MSFFFISFQFNNNNNKKNLYIDYTMNRQLSKAQRSLEKALNKKGARIASNVVAVILVLVAVLLVPHLPLGGLEWLDHIAARVVLMIVIVIVCLLDPVVALLLAILFVVCLQRLHKLKKERNAQVVLSALNTVVKNNKLDELKDALNNSGANVNATEEELVEDELPTVEDQTNVLPANNMDNSQVALAEVTPANMKDEVEYNLTPNNLNNVVQVNLANNAAGNANGNANGNAAGNNPNQIGALLEEGSDNVLSANNTEHFLSVENASGNQNNVLTAKIVCRKSGFENDVELVQEAKRNNEPKPEAVANNRPTCKPFTTEHQFKDVQSNLVNCKENNNNLATQGHGNMENVPQGTML